LGALLDVCPDENGELRCIENAENLQSLSLGGQLVSSMRLFGDDGLCASSRMVTSSLTSLDLSTMVCTDDDIEALLTLAKNIQSINISSTRISGASIKMLADGLPHLRHLKSDNCPNVSSRDAVAYAERKGIFVSCRTTDSIGGKKVRHGLF
jgi:F-box/TPR repeat protein Pof3